MNTAEIKNDLHKLIVETDDINILSKIQAYFNTLKSRWYSVEKIWGICYYFTCTIYVLKFFFRQ